MPSTPSPHRSESGSAPAGPPAARRPIGEVAADLGFDPGELVPAGAGVLRIPVAAVRARASAARPGKLVLVTAMTPTEHGEGKTVVAIGLAMALRRRGRRSVVCLRQPSLGPVFGAKGGASGSGRSAVEPRNAIDLGFTGDLDAIANAQNLLASFVDHSIFEGNPLGIDPTQAVLPRASSLEDRALRDISSGLTAKATGFPRPAQFVITPATEMAAIHALASDYADLKGRLGRMTVARRSDGRPVLAADVAPIEAVASLVGPALGPNLVQTVEGTPALVHGVPYANVAHGTCSRLAMEAGVAGSDFCVVEAGFSSDLGAEKFVDVVSPQTRLAADVAVVVATVRAIRWHGSAGPGDGAVDAIAAGLDNLAQHLENVRRIGLDPIVALNRFPTDSPEEIDRVARFCTERSVAFAVVTAFADGGAGAEELADRVVEAAVRGRRSRSLYGPSATIEEILRTVVTQVYGGSAVEFTESARADLDRLRKDGGAEGPVCVAKTPLSLSADAHLRGRPTGFTVTIRHLYRWTGAGFTVAIAGPIVAMPGLPARPAASSIRFDDDGNVSGLA